MSPCMLSAAMSNYNHSRYLAEMIDHRRKPDRCAVPRDGPATTNTTCQTPWCAAIATGFSPSSDDCIRQT